MKTFLRYFFVYLLIFLGLFYLLGTFQIKLFDYWLIYESWNSEIKLNKQLRFATPNVTSSYVYVLKTEVTNKDHIEMFYQAFQDAEILRRRLKGYLGDSFEVRSDILKEGKIYHRVYLNNSLDEYGTLLTALNQKFEIKKASNLDFSLEQNSQESEVLDLQRSDFGLAEVMKIASSETYYVRLPLSYLISYEKIKYIQERLAQRFSMEVGGFETVVYFDYTDNNAPTGLLLGGLKNKSQADFVKSLLNSGPVNFSYTIESIYYQNKSDFYQILSYSVTLLVLIFVFIYLIKIAKKRHVLKLNFYLYSALIFVISVALLKLFDLSISIFFINVLATILVLAFHNLGFILTLVLSFILLLTYLMTILHGLDINILGLLIMLLCLGFYNIVFVKYVSEKKEKFK